MRILSKLFFAFVSLLVCCNFSFSQEEYKHKSEKEIANMSPEERVDELVKERYHHYPYDGINMVTNGVDQSTLINSYLRKDGVKVLPALIDIANGHDPDQPPDYETKRMYVAFLLANDIDNMVVRIRSTKEGRSLIKAFEHVFDRMRKAGYDNEKHPLNRRFQQYFLRKLETLKGKTTSPTDGIIHATLQKKHNIQISKEEGIRFSNFLTSLDPNYPSWCKIKFPPLLCIDSKEYYDAYKTFKIEEEKFEKKNRKLSGNEKSLK